MCSAKVMVPATLPRNGPVVICNGKSVSRMWESYKNQRVVWLTLLVSVLLPINFVMKLDILLTI